MNPELSGFITAAKSIAYDAKTLFGGLSERQLNWQPNAESWSVGLCLEHLIKTNDEMLGAVESHITGAHKKTIFERLGFGSKYFGNYVLKAVQPENKSKLKAPKVFQPFTSNVSGDAVERFVANQERVIELMRRSNKLDLEKTIITSPAARFITYSLSNAYKIIITHERRHFRQAQNVMELPEFPKA
ncbi:MAG: DinB family protein [Acidobacteriota bacterium]|nr:DinB family protein [Acidobacteriota bacterium]